MATVSKYDSIQHAHLIDLSEARHMRLRSRITTSELRDRNVRYDRGLLTYENCSTPELSNFAVQRNTVTPGSNSKDAKRNLIQALHQADDNQTFSHLLDLPPEVRVFIYEFHFANFFAEHIHMPTNPPLADVSQLLRKEVSPIFYTMLKRIKSLCIYIRNAVDDSYYEEDQIVQLELNKDGSEYKVWMLECTFGYSQGKLRSAARAVIEQKLRGVMDGVVGRELDQGKFILADVYRLAWAMDDAWSHEALLW
nr:hypothetical protein B0A51_07330 [Rachicladosporium sp. CCFEE 5018]OQO30992.1 hypothetical protein B0A51_01231 [Rachicladosporium sp. CCFEE 5018]